MTTHSFATNSNNSILSYDMIWQIIDNNLFMKIISNRVLTLAVLLICSSMAIRKQIPPTSLPLIGDLYYQNGEIFFIAADELSFGHVNKGNGSISLKYKLELFQKMLLATPYQIMISKLTEFTQYETFGRKQFRLASPFSQMTGASNTSAHVGFQVFPFGQYLCLSQQLYLLPYSRQNNTLSIPIPLTLASDQKLISLHIFQSILLLVSVTPAQLCFTQIDYTQIKRRKCVVRAEASIEPKIIISGKFVYAVYSNTKLQVFDHDFGLIQSFQESVLQYFKGSASFVNWKTYDANTRTINNQKLVAHNREGSNSLILQSGNYILKQGTQTIIKIPNITSQPYGIWLNKSQVYLGKVQGKYQILVQFSTGAANFYQIIAEQGQDPSITLLWSI